MTADPVANLLAMSDWTDSDAQSEILRQAATALEASRLTEAEREAIRFAAVFYALGGRQDDAARLRGLLERRISKYPASTPQVTADKEPDAVTKPRQKRQST